MDQLTEGVYNLAIVDSSNKKNRIQVSYTKKPLFFYVNLAKFGGSNGSSSSCARRSRLMANGSRTCSFVRFSPRCARMIHHSDLQKELDTTCLWTPLGCHYRPLRHIVRSDLVNNGTPEGVKPVSEVDLSSKARGLCFYMVTAVLALCCIGPMLVAHPFVLIVDPYRRGFQHLVARTWSTLTMLPFIKVEYEGLENLPSSETPAVYVSNHQSFLDIYTLLTLRSNFKFISKTSIFLFPVIGWAMLLLGVIPLKRMDTRSQVECLKRCMDLINQGASIFFFPEGTRSKDGRLGTFKKGAFSVAVKTGVPVVPMTISGTGSIMPSGKEGILNHGSVKVVVHRSLTGNDPEVLCREARSIIADTLDHCAD